MPDRVNPRDVLANPDHRELYLHSASFKVAIERLCDTFLPAMLDGLAERAREADAQVQAHIEATRRADPIQSIPIPDRLWRREDER